MAVYFQPKASKKTSSKSTTNIIIFKFLIKKFVSIKKNNLNPTVSLWPEIIIYRLSCINTIIALNTEMGFFSFFEKMAPFVAMVVLETIVVGSNTINKAALSTGMSRYFLIFYSSTLAATVLVLFSLFFHRFLSPLPSFYIYTENLEGKCSNFFVCRGKRPPVSFSVLRKIFLVSFIG